MKGEHFLPFRRSDVVAMCAAELPPADRERFLGVTRVLASLLHHRFHERVELLKDAYQGFQPEAETRSVTALDPAARDAARNRVEAELMRLAQEANFTQMSLAEVEEAMRGHSLIKVRLEIDTDDVDRVLLFRRGETLEERTELRLFGLWRKKVTFTRYSRVLVYAKFKEAEHFTPKELKKLPFRPGSIVMKLFQNVPRDDLEMIFPNVRVAMRLIDKLFIGIPALVSGVIVFATKLYWPLLLILTVIGVWLGLRFEKPSVTETSLIALGLGLFAFGSYAFRQFNNFKNRKILFMKALSESLYHRNIDNDAGVFHNLVDAAEEAEVIEAVLAYHFLRQAGRPLTARELDERVEQWFAQHWQTTFDFDVHDGLRKLRDLGLVTGSDDALTPLNPDVATAVLNRLWDSAFVSTEPATVAQPVVSAAI